MTSHSSATMREATPHENEARTNNILRTVRFFVTLWRHTIRGWLNSYAVLMRAKRSLTGLTATTRQNRTTMSPVRSRLKR